MGTARENDRIIIEKLDSFRELVELKFDNNSKEVSDIKEHLTRLNSQTAKNTKFRIRGNVYFKGLYIGLTAVLIPTVLMVIDKLTK